MDTQTKPNARRISVRAAGLLVALLGSMLTPPGANAEPQRSGDADIRASLAALRGDVEGLINHPGVDMAALDTDLQRAEQLVGRQNCEAVASLDRYAARLGAADGTAARQRLLEQGEQVRFDILASVPANDGCKGDIKVSVDKKIKPSVATAPGYQRGTARPVAAVRASDGTQTDFIANELVLTTRDQAKADALVRRWRGAVLKKLAPTEVRGWIPMYLVRIDTGRADPAKLTRDLEKLNKPRIKRSHSGSPVTRDAGC